MFTQKQNNEHNEVYFTFVFSIKICGSQSHKAETIHGGILEYLSSKT